jgi:hypothetical protein
VFLVLVLLGAILTGPGSDGDLEAEYEQLVHDLPNARIAWQAHKRQAYYRRALDQWMADRDKPRKPLPPVPGYVERRAKVERPPEQGKQNSTASAGAGGGFALVLLLGVAVFVLTRNEKSSSQQQFTRPPERSLTEQERNEQTMRGYFHQKYPNVPPEERDAAAKRIAEEWERAKPSP